MLFLDKIFKDFSLFFLSKNLNHNRGPILPSPGNHDVYLLETDEVSTEFQACLAK